MYFLGPTGTPYHPGCYKAQLSFPNEYPFKPPEFKILSTFWHPNVYTDGKICISILHAPGTDEMNTIETASMRWTPVQSIEKVLVSIVSVLSDPDPSDAGAPANVDALVEYRKNRSVFTKKCVDNAAKSLRELPAGFVKPQENDAAPVQAPAERPVSLTFDDFDDGGDDGGDDDDYGSSATAPTGGAAGGGSQYSAELRQLRSMGLGADKSDAQLLEMLKARKGDVSLVSESLM